MEFAWWYFTQHYCQSPQSKQILQVVKGEFTHLSPGELRAVNAK